MGVTLTLSGHVEPGIGFFVLGFWHLINNVRRYCQNPLTYTSASWFPSPFISRYLELYLIMIGCSSGIVLGLFIVQRNHQPLDPRDWSIPSSHVHNFEHASIYLGFIVYSLFSLLLDKTTNTSKSKSSTANSLAQLLFAVAFSQQLFMLHVHSKDHTGIEGQYHWLIQVILGVTLVTTLMGIGYKRSFVVSFVRSLSIMFQGIWFCLTGMMLSLPQFIPKGCFTTIDDDRLVVKCNDDWSLHRAKALVNIGFSWCFIAVTALAMLVYMVMQRFCSHSPEYSSLENPTSAISSFSSDEEEGLGLRRERSMDMER